MTGLTDFQRMQLAAHHAANRAAELGLTAQDIRNMPWDEYSRVFGTTGRQTPAQAARAAVNAEHEARHPTQAPVPQSAPQQPAPEPQGVTLQDMSMDEYALLRQQLGVGVSQKEGRGIFDSVSSQSDAYTSAVRAQAGRGALSNANVEPAPQLTGRTILRQDDHLDRRPVSERFGTYGNANQF